MRRGNQQREEGERPAPPEQGAPSAEGALRLLARVASLGLALATLAALLVTAVLAAVAGEAPDAYTADQKFGPVPAQPRSWGQSKEAIEAAAVAALGFGVLAASTGVCWRFASARRPVLRRRAAVVVAGPPALVLALLATVLAANRGDARLPPDCGTFRFSQAAFRSDEPNRWEPQAIGLRECGAYVGRTPAQTRRLLGDPDPREPGQSRTLWTYHDGFVQLRFNGGRAQDLSP